jgi:hypothetical protein
MAEDNLRKVRYLAGIVHNAIVGEDLSAVEKIRRLPWTAPILKQVNDLVILLRDNGQRSNDMGRSYRNV